MPPPPYFSPNALKIPLHFEYEYEKECINFYSSKLLDIPSS